jgi:hypothetical protein
MARLLGRRLIASASLGLLLAIVLQLPAHAGQRTSSGYLFDKLTPKAKISNQLLAATLARDEKTARVLLVKEGFNSDVLNSLQMSFSPPPAPIDEGTVYLDPAYFAGGKQVGAIFVFASTTWVQPPPGGCARTPGGGTGTIAIDGGNGQYNSPC